MVAAVQQGKRNRILMLFGLPFLLAGLAVLIAGPLHTLRLHYLSAHWDQVPARLHEVALISSRGSDSTTYRVQVRYDYDYRGRRYQGDRASYDTGSDNIGDDQARLAARLEQVHRAGHEVMVWVNPDNPVESLLVRELRWNKLLFGSVFGLIFVAAGTVMVLWGARRIHGVEPARVQGPIHSTERYGYWLWLAMGSLFVLMPLPAMIELPAMVSGGEWAILVVLVFPAVGAWLFYLGVRGRRSWRHYGPLPVEMDPQPGQIGGEVAGRIHLPQPWQGDNPYRVTLQCLLSSETGSGKNRRRSESLVWQQEQVPHAEATGAGTELRFLFEPPAELPASEMQGRRYHLWKLLLCGPASPVPLERTYTLPVVKGSGRSRIVIPDRHREREQQQARVRALDSVVSQIAVSQQGGAVQIHTPFGLHMGIKLVLLVCGLVFAGAALFLTLEALKEGGMLWFMAVLFSAFGYPMLAGGIFTTGRSLRAEVRQGRLRTVRYWCGVPLWRRELVLDRAEQFALKAGSSSNDGRRHQQYFHLEAVHAGRRVRVAEDILGREAAEALRDSLIRLLGLR
ncbi:MAG: DUF3592 domain-containing protein [Alcanivoracaceae bacterium]